MATRCQYWMKKTSNGAACYGMKVDMATLLETVVAAAGITSYVYVLRVIWGPDIIRLMFSFHQIFVMGDGLKIRLCLANVDYRFPNECACECPQ